jgi:hypothetical protein
MRLPFTEKFLWDLYKALKLTSGALDKFCSIGVYRNLRGIIDFFKYPDYFDFKKTEQERLGKERFGRLIKYLKYNGYLYIKKDRNKNAVILTSKGAQKILDIKKKLEGKSKRKDGKWQMVIFDIPEDIKSKRDYFRAGLKRLDYEKLQQSIWICEYDVFKETKELIKYFKLESFVKLLLLEEINID